MPIRIKATVAILLSLLLLALLGPLILPIRPLQGTVAESELADPDSLFAPLADVTVHYKERGEGPLDVVLLHGFGSSAFTWHRVLDGLGEYARAVAFDRPGFGLTSRPLAGQWSGTNPYSPEGQVETTLALMDALGIERAVLVGNSAGGVVATTIALEHPERVEALVLVSPALFAGGGAPAWSRWLLRTPQLERVGPLVMRQFGEAPGAQFLRAAWADPDAIPDDIVRGYRQPLRANHWDRALWELTKASREPVFGAELAGIDVPVLIVAGEEDAFIPLEQNRRAADAIPGTSLVTFEGCGHVPQEECPEAFLGAVNSFLADRARGR